MFRSTRFIMMGLALLTLVVSASIGPASAQDQAPGHQFKPLDPGPVIVVLKSGERIQGELIEDRPGSVKLRVAKIEVRIPRDQIESVYPEIELMERYRLLRESIPQDDADQILFLAEWLRRNEMLDEALAETMSALKVDPVHGGAIRFRKLIEQQILLRDRAQEKKARRESGVPPSDDTSRSRGRRRRIAFPLISEQDANLIKVFEVNLNDPPRMLISGAVIDALLDQYGGRLGVPSTREGRATFHRKPPVEILEAMYRLRARDLYGDVQVLGLPDSLKIFRDNVNSTWLVNSCATTKCHGGANAGTLMLANRRPSSDRSFLTNFLILENYQIKDGSGLINYASPASSPLLQMTLPRHESLFPHPDVKGWRPNFTNTKARRFKQAVKWIESMYQPRPEYPIEYTPPIGGVGGGDNAETGDSREPPSGPIER